MIRIHTISVGKPKTITDAKGTWRTAIFRSPVAGPIELGLRGLAGDKVADTKHHGAPDQAVCCHPLRHYAAWNADYGLVGAQQLGAGGVGENWTLENAGEEDVCIGDSYAVGSALVQVSGPRYPCTKQERKLGLAGFNRRTIETLRTGWYLLVLEPGVVEAGDTWELRARPHPEYTIERISACGLQEFDPAFAQAACELPELSDTWKYIFQTKLAK